MAGDGGEVDLRFDAGVIATFLRSSVSLHCRTVCATVEPTKLDAVGRGEDDNEDKWEVKLAVEMVGS